MRKLFIVLLITCLMLWLVACGNANISEENDVTVYYFGKTENIEQLPEIENPLNAEKIYNSIEYNEKMLFGNYYLNNKDKELKKFVKNSEYVEIEYCSSIGVGGNLLKKAMGSQFPYKIIAGPANLKIARTDRTQEWAELYYATENGGTLNVLCTYTVEGNTVKYTPLDDYKVLYDEEYRQIGTEYTVGKDSIDYTFSFKGPQITLSQGEDSITLYSYRFSENTDAVSIGGYPTLETAKIDNMENFSGVTSEGYCTLYIRDINNKLISDGIFKLTEDGIATLYWVTEDENGNAEEYLRQFVYFDCGNDSMILADEENIYYYTENKFSYEIMHLGDGMTTEEISTLNELSEDKIEEIVDKKEDLLSDLTTAFKQAGINVVVNVESGEISVDSSVLFGGDSSVVTAEGKELLNKFLNVYASIIFNEKYTGFVSKTLIEGHTALLSGSTYESGLPLSVERADNVKTYCLLAETGVDENYITELTKTLEAVGCSNSKPIYDSDGNIDLAASRRVSFRFIVNLE